MVGSSKQAHDTLLSSTLSITPCTGGALESCGRIAAATGAALICENAFSRLDRGAGLPALQRLPYFPQEAAAALAPYQLLLMVDARRPVANFGYDGAPSQLVSLPVGGSAAAAWGQGRGWGVKGWQHTCLA